MSRAQLLQRVPLLMQRPVLSVLLLVVIVVVSMCCGHRVGKHLPEEASVRREHGGRQTARDVAESTKSRVVRVVRTLNELRNKKM